jgi:hypothetical protein
MLYNHYSIKVKALPVNKGQKKKAGFFIPA